MGSVARVGILGGKRVASDVLLGSALASTTLDTNSSVAPESIAECAASDLKGKSKDIAERLAAGKPLSRTELATLLTDAPLSELMKLSLVAMGTDNAVSLPRPIVLLPIDEWRKSMSEATIKDSAIQLLKGLPFADLDVTFDWLNLGHFEQLLKLSDELGRRRPGLRFVGPTSEEIVAWLEKGEGPKLPKLAPKGKTGRASKQVLNRLSEVLHAMRRANYYRLKVSSNLAHMNRFEILDRLAETGLTAVVGTSVCENPGEVVEQILALRSFLDSGSTVGIWLPHTDRESVLGSGRRGISELRLLRTIALGTISLRGIPVRRASSAYLSVEGLGTARLFGANDLGYGAVDDTTMHALGMVPYQTLLHAFAR